MVRRSAFLQDLRGEFMFGRPEAQSQIYLGEAAPNEEIFEIMKQLVTIAGHVTIRGLFSHTRNDVSAAVASAIANAKRIGFLALSNDKCCHEVDDPFKDDYCTTQQGQWCSLVKKETKLMCTLASDKC